MTSTPPETAPVEFLTCAETATLVRAALKRAYPKTKFSVRSSVYSGGASIDVKWADGPRLDHVERIVKRYEGADFDGMIDLKTNRMHYLVEGRDAPLLARAHEGTTIPAIRNAPPDVPNVRRIHFGADFIFCRRYISDEDTKIDLAAAIIRERCKTEGNQPYDEFGTRYVTDLARTMVHTLHFPDLHPEMLQTDLETAFREVILGERPEDSA